MHGETIRHQVKNMYKLNNATVHGFHQVVRFEIGAHNVNMQPRREQQHQIFPTKFIMTEEEVEVILNDLPKKWRVLVPEDQLRQEKGQLQEENPDEGKEEEYPQKDLD